MKMKHFILILVGILIQLGVEGQENNYEFGKIKKEEIELKAYPKDKTAHAVVLYDKGRSYFAENRGAFDVIYERSTRIKVFSEAGAEWAEVEIPFYQEGGIFEKVLNIEAFAFNMENGVLTRTQLDLSNVYEEKINNYWNVKKFAVPNVKAGTIIEYRYQIDSQYLFNLRDWEFQWRIPVIHSEYQVEIIPFYEYIFLLQGADRFTSQKSYVSKGFSRQYAGITFQNMIHNFVMKDLPAVENEEFITSLNDHIIKIDFQLSRVINPHGAQVNIMTTWEKLNSDLLKNQDFGKYVEGSQKLAKKLLNTEDQKFENELEKFNFIIDYVKHNYNWNEHNGYFASKAPKKLVDEKIGNDADLNLFTIGLLNASGIEAKPVLLSTRSHGKISYDYPFASFFNYVAIIANVDGQRIFGDATEVLGLNHRLPSRCINGRGLVVQKNEVEWVELSSQIPSTISTTCIIALGQDGEINANMSTLATEYDALDYRKEDADKVENIVARLQSPGYELLESTIEVQNYFEKDRPYVQNYQLKAQAQMVNDKLYLSPFLGASLTDNPLKQKERTYPLDFIYPKRRTFRSVIQIPEGYTLDYIPSNQRINNELFDLNYVVGNENNTLTLVFDYCLKKSIYPAADYSKVRSWFDQVVKKSNEQIVLVKTSTN